MKKLLFILLLATSSAFAQKISLTTQVRGILPVANGGSGSAAPALIPGTNITITGSWPNQTINSSGGSGISGLTSPFIPKATSATAIGNSLLSDDGTTLTYAGTGGVATTGAGAGKWKALEGTAPTCLATFDFFWADSTTHRFMTCGNGGSALPVAGLVASGTATLGTTSIPANSCATVVTVSATGVASTDTIEFTPNASIKAVTGYTPAGTLSIVAYPTAGNVNFDVCNKDQTNAVTPGAVTLNWRVPR